MNLKLRADELRRQIEHLCVLHPELVEDDILRADMIEGETDFQQFLAYLTDKANDCKFQAEGVKAYLAEIAERKARLDRRSETIRELILSLMLEAGCEKLPLPMATVSVRDGKPKVVVTDEALIPDELCRVKRYPNKTAIREKIEAGDSIAGAMLSNAEPVLTIRIK